ncbi:SDR family oxidoreductase [Streptomyces sp. NPDC046977]|uniref:SDR family oxidoreductase n=1 Tax=Streptomyces sp. NPDC046977 TaxID=3154703 RepID=UPI0033FA24A3
MPEQTPNRVALITGGAGGIGQATARRLVADGYAVAINYINNRERAGQAVKEITEQGAHAIAVRADVADERETVSMLETVEQTLGGVDVIVNAAGMMPVSTVVDLDMDLFDRMVRVNLRGAFVVAKHGAHRLRPGGAFLSVSTSQVGMRFPTYGPYAATKGATEILVSVLSKELRGRNITANVVAPGPIATSSFYEGKDEATVDRLTNLAPLERLGAPEDVAEVIAYLAGPAGRWINGQVIRPNGGVV